MIQENAVDRSREITLAEVLDRVLNKGIVLSGDVLISVADVDLIYLGVKLLVTSVETMQEKDLAVAKRSQSNKNNGP